MKLIELTLGSGRRIGLPQLSAVIISAIPDTEGSEEKTLIRWCILGQGARIARVKDSFRQVLNLFPKSTGGLGWTHAVDEEGNDFAFPEGTISSFEEQEGEGESIFELTLGCETGPLTVKVKASYEDVQAMLGNTEAAK